MADALEALREPVGEFVLALVEEHGFQMPIYHVGIARNGSIIGGDWEETADQLSCDAHVMRDREGGIRLPLNIMFVDCTGRAAGLLIDTEGTKSVDFGGNVVPFKRKQRE
jgi:hypothetical protein